MTAIIAVASNGCIGKNSGLPWKMKDDLAFFKRITTNGTVAMGRKTYESLGKPLKNRLNIVLTRYPGEYRGQKNVIFTNSTKILSDDTLVIGGKELIESLIDEIDTIYVTHIEADIDGDTFIDVDNLTKNFQNREELFKIVKSNRNDYSATVVKYSKNK